MNIKHFLRVFDVIFIIFLCVVLGSEVFNYYIGPGLFMLVIIYAGGRIAYKVHQTNKFDKIDYKNKDYYREILKKYSVGELSYLDDFSLEENDIIATIMFLELKGYLRVTDKIEILKQVDSNLVENEKYIMNVLINESYARINLLTYQEKVIDDCRKKGLLRQIRYTEKVKASKIHEKILLVCLIILIICALLELIFNISYNGGLVENLFTGITFGTVFVFLVMIAYMAFHDKLQSIDPYVRTEVSKDLNKKMEGLKKYIKDFSLMEEREKEDMVLWEEYLIYSVIFGINGKIVEEYKGKINMYRRDSY